MRKLMLCSGRTKRAGWETLDIDARVKPTYVARIPEEWPDKVLDTYWDEIELIHGIEHFYYWQAQEVLGTCHRILKVGGKLVLEQPNIEFAAKVLLGEIPKPRGHVDQFDMWPLYGDPNHKNTNYIHRWGYTPRTLRIELEKAGFQPHKIVERRARSHFPVRDFRLEATA